MNTNQSENIVAKNIVEPATTNIDFTKKTVKELKALCKDKHLCFSKKNKNDLISLLKGINKITTHHSLIDTYTDKILRDQYLLHKEYVLHRKQTLKLVNVEFRSVGLPEDISENIIKFIIRNKLGDTTSRWNCKGDLLSDKFGIQECKSFTSNGPISFTPSSNWAEIYFLDSRNWLENKFALWRVCKSRTSDDWKKIKVSKLQTFDDQCKQGRRPRINWEKLYPQISLFCEKVFEGIFDDIFIS